MLLKRYLPFLIAAAASVLISSTWANQPTAASAAATPKKRILFVISAGKASVKRDHQDYHLSFDLNSLKQSLLFTARPYRLVKFVNKKVINEAWHGKSKTKNFTQDAPNAVLTTQNHQPIVITITRMHLAGHYFSIDFHPIKPHMFTVPVGPLNEVVLTIDSTATDIAGGVGGVVAVAGISYLVKQAVDADKAAAADTPVGEASNATSATDAAIETARAGAKQSGLHLYTDGDEDEVEDAAPASTDADASSAATGATESTGSTAGDGSMMGAVKQIIQDTGEDAANAVPITSATGMGEGVDIAGEEAAATKATEAATKAQAQAAAEAGDNIDQLFDIM